MKKIFVYFTLICVLASTTLATAVVNLCYDYTCSLAGCAATPKNCDDGNSCTADSCNPATGCIHTPISCDDQNACTVDSCNVTTGCHHSTRNCDDGVFCNGIESCNITLGCVSGKAVDCSEFNLDSVSSCTNDPDGKNLTFDSFAGFVSSCDEGFQACTEGTVDISHVCSKECGAECVTDSDCGKGEKCSDCTCKGNDVPEFGTLAALVALAGAVTAFFIVRKT